MSAARWNRGGAAPGSGTAPLGSPRRRSVPLPPPRVEPPPGRGPLEGSRTPLRAPEGEKRSAPVGLCSPVNTARSTFIGSRCLPPPSQPKLPELSPGAGRAGRPHRHRRRSGRGRGQEQGSLCVLRARRKPSAGPLGPAGPLTHSHLHSARCPGPAGPFTTKALPGRLLPLALPRPGGHRVHFNTLGLFFSVAAGGSG